VPARQLAHARDLVGQRVVAHVAVVEIGEDLRAPRRAHPVDLHDDEAELGERLMVAACGEKLREPTLPPLRARVDVVDDRVR
jgi:hypothetical protein